MKWFMKWLDRPICYPRLLDLQWFEKQKITNTNTPLFKNPKKAYNEYLIEYKIYKRDQKIKDLLK